MRRFRNRRREPLPEIVGATSRLEVTPLVLDDPKQRMTDIPLAEPELGSRPLVVLPDGLKETVGSSRTRLAE